MVPGRKHIGGVGHGRMARCGHGLPKVSPGPAKPYPSMPWGRVTPETALLSFLGWPAHKAGGLRPSSTPLDTPRRTPLFKDTHPTSLAFAFGPIFVRIASVHYWSG
jgi:hypothetical protein